MRWCYSPDHPERLLWDQSQFANLKNGDRRLKQSNQQSNKSRLLYRLTYVFLHRWTLDGRIKTHHQLINTNTQKRESLQILNQASKGCWLNPEHFGRVYPKHLTITATLIQWANEDPITTTGQRLGLNRHPSSGRSSALTIRLWLECVMLLPLFTNVLHLKL